jgi:LysM repeat protein/N-acetylmuramoyl-L-alanine amidase
MKKHIVISIGHGVDTWEKGGGKGVRKNGRVYEEHDANVHLALKVKKLVEAHGIKVTLVQPPNAKDVPLKTRTDKANALGVVLYWSIHHNAGAPSASGACAFYWHTSSVGKKLSYALANNMKKRGINLHGNGVHVSMRGSWTNFHELRETKMVAVLTENGFMTNSRDFENIFGKNREAYHSKLAEAHAETIIESFFGMKYDPSKTGESKPTQPTPVSGHIGIATVKVDSLNLRTEPSTKGKVIRALGKGESYRVYEIKNGWYNLGGNQWASNVGGKYMTFKAVEKAPDPKGDTHTVVKGDTLWSLAQHYNTTVAKLKELNGLKSDILQIGQVLRVSDKTPVYHTVKKGETLWGIANNYNTTVAKIKSLNGLKSDVIQSNQKLRVK